MTSAAQRTLLEPFLLANPIYAGGKIYVYVADTTTGRATTALATLYRAPTGTQEESNPFRLDEDGKLLQPVYVEVPVVARIRETQAPVHDTGIIGVAAASGWEAATGTATRSTFDTTTITTEELAERFKALTDDLLARGSLAP